MNRQPDRSDHPPRASNRRKDRRQGFLQLVLIILFIGGAFILSTYLASFETPPEPEAPDRDLVILVRTELVAPQAYSAAYAFFGLRGVL